MRRKRLLTAIVIFILLGLLIILPGLVDSKMVLSFEEYTFEIEAEPVQDTILTNFQIFYDLSEKKGHISFDLLSSKRLSWLRITVPAEFVINDFFWDDDSTNKKFFVNGTDYHHNLEKLSILEITNFDTVKPGRSAIKILFDGSMFPNGQFFIDLSRGNVVYGKKGVDRGAFFKYASGSSYSPVEIRDCFRTYGNEALIPNFDKNAFTVSMLKAPPPSQEDPPLKGTFFGLNCGKNTELNRVITILQDILLAIFGALFGFLIAKSLA